MTAAAAHISPGAERPSFAALFWFYKAFDVCRERIALLRRFNPDVAVYGLYGGEPGDADAAREALGDLLDDLYVYEGAQDATWRWIHGDQVIAGWWRDCGRALGAQTVVVVQWDMLIAAPLTEALVGLAPGEAAFSGDRPLAEVEGWWGWGGAGDAHQRAELAGFRARLRGEFDYDGPLWCCLFIIAALPCAFLDRYAAASQGEAGFLEYKLPTLARVFGTPVRALPQLKAWWRAEPATRNASARERVLNATRTPVDEALILSELSRVDGRRVFHPVFETPAALRALAAETQVDR